jgi:ATP-dependent Clp protease ATP-binding subunit ClpC
VFVIVGPTGVGKTTFTEELTDFLFGDRQHLIELDMSQFVSPESAAELRGPPVGVSGWERGGRLANAVKARPHSVVVFDEVDKAHPSVWDVLLPVLDDGMMTDTLDRTIDFSNTVIILTSNAGSRHALGRAVGFMTTDAPATSDNMERDVRTALEDVLGAELLNRADEVLVFRPLDRSVIGRIVERKLAAVGPVQIEATPAAVELLTEKSYHPARGGRVVKRTVQRLVTNPLSLMLARGELTEGDLVRVDVSDGALTFERRPRASGS